MRRMRAVTSDAQAVERGNPHGRGEISVAPASCHGRLLQFEASRRGMALRLREQIGAGGGSLVGRPLDPRLDFQPDVGRAGLQSQHA
jgi:hypothetical protein